MTDKRDARRKEILEAALHTFSEKGYDKTSIDEVVDATGLSKGTIYWYFKNKQAMFTALMEYVIDQFFAEFEDVLSAAKNLAPQETIAAIFETTQAMLGANPKVASLTVDFMVQALHYPEMRRKYAGYYARYIDELGAIIQRGIDGDEFRATDARAASAVLIGLLDGVMLQTLVADEMDLNWQWELKDILTVAETLFRKGLVKGTGSDRA